MIDATYPPLTAVEDYPLHGWDYEGMPYACQRPEDADCNQYDWRCPKCLLAAQTSLMNDGDKDVRWKHNADAPEQSVKLSWLIDRSIFWMAS